MMMTSCVFIDSYMSIKISLSSSEIGHTQRDLEECFLTNWDEIANRRHYSYEPKEVISKRKEAEIV